MGWYGLTDSMLESQEGFVEALRQFRLMRAEVIEKEYYETHSDGCNQRMRNELYDRLLRLLGANKPLLIEFADRDAACFNPNTDYFYNRGFADCLIFLKTLDRVGGRDILINRFMQCAETSGGEW
jgi:hypothetical protein